VLHVREQSSGFDRRSGGDPAGRAGLFVVRAAAQNENIRCAPNPWANTKLARGLKFRLNTDVAIAILCFL